MSLSTTGAGVYGNVGTVQSWSTYVTYWYNVPGIYWSVQAIDGSFVGSTFAGEQYFSFDGTTTRIDDSDLPSQFALKGNHPNPFNPATTISFDLPRKSDVELVIYDAAGRRVRKLLRDSMSAGSHSVLWDGNDDGSVRVGSGIYFYRLVAGSYEAAKSMVLVR